MSNVIKLFTFPERMEEKQKRIIKLLEYNKKADSANMDDCKRGLISREERLDFFNQLETENINLIKMLRETKYPIMTKRVVGISNCDIDDIISHLLTKYDKNKICDDSEYSYHRIAATDDIIDQVLGDVIKFADLDNNPTVKCYGGFVNEAFYEIDDLEDTPDLWYY